MSKQVNKETTKLVRIDARWHQYAKLEAAKLGRSVKSLLEEGLAAIMDRPEDEND
jgi:predicted HicB family RNase H-like nuclease